MFSGILTKIKENQSKLLLYMIDHNASIVFIVFNVMHISCIAFRFDSLFRLDINAVRIVSGVTNGIVAWVLGFEASYKSFPFISLTDKYHYILTYLLCGLSNVLTIIISVNAWSMENIDANDRLELMIIYGTTIALIAAYTYLDGFFIYHKLRNAERDIYEHIIVVGSFVFAASNILLFVLAIYFIVFSNCDHAHFCSSILLMIIIPGLLHLSNYDFTPQIANKTVQRLLVCIHDFRILSCILLFFGVVNETTKISSSHMYDVKTARKNDIANEGKIRVAYSFLSNFILHCHTIAVRSICLLQRTVPAEERLEDWDSDSETGSDTSSEIRGRRRG